MQQSLLFIMSITGTTVFFLYLLVYPLAKRYFTAKWRYSILKISLLFFLFPFSEFKFKIIQLLYWIFPTIITPTHNKAYMTPEIAFDNNGEIIKLARQTQLIWFIFIIFGIIALGLVIKQLMKYYKARKLVFTYATQISSGTIYNEFQLLKAKLKIKSGVRIYDSDIFQTPMVIGVFTPVIILPSSKEFDKNTLSLILEHELIHIKHFDLLIKFIGLIAVAVHWFNPICYALFYELCNQSELYCDSMVINGKSDLERTAYGNLILDIAFLDDKRKTLLPIAKLIGNDAKILKRRILAMKKPLVSPKKLTACFTGVAITLMSGLTAFAYEPPMTLYGANNNSNIDGLFSSGIQSEVESLPFDSFFTDSNGIIYNVSEPSGEKIICHHEYESGMYTTHTTHSDGGCTTKNYNAKKCLFCNSIVLGSTINTVVYEVCPH